MGLKSHQTSVSPIIFTAVLNTWVYHVWAVIIVVFRVHRWVKLLMSFLYQAPDIIPFVSLKSGQHGGSFNDGIYSTPPSYDKSVCYLRFLSSSFNVKGKEKLLIFLRRLWESHINNWNAVIQPLALGLLINMWLLKGTLFLHMECLHSYSFKLSISQSF